MYKRNKRLTIFVHDFLNLPENCEEEIVIDDHVDNIKICYCRLTLEHDRKAL